MSKASGVGFHLYEDKMPVDPEVINICEEFSGREMKWTYEENNRVGDHIWWISDVRKFKSHFPEWEYRYGIREILEEIVEAQMVRK